VNPTKADQVVDESVTMIRDRWSGEPLGTFPSGGASEAREAVTAAVRAMETGLPIPERSAVLARVADYIADRAEDFARAIRQETGKPVGAARVEVGRAVGTLRYSAEEARRLPSEAVPLDATEAGAGTLALTVAEPRGVVAAITPFNFPINLVVHKIGPALAAGCALVFKPSDKAVLVARMLVAAFEECGLPAGWLNLVTGPAEPIVGAWLEDDRVAVITFTGSSNVGWKIKADSPRKMHILELGSNTAMYVHDDADLTRAVADAVTAGYGNSGQACVSLQRLYIHEDVAEEFTELLVTAVAAIPFGDPSDPATVVGPLITPLATEKVVAWLDEAVARGARVRQGGAVTNEVVAPTLLTDVPTDSPLIREEVFGPVVTVIPVAGLENALSDINSSDFGLNAAVHTRSLAVAMEFGRRAQAGSVLVNMPPSFRADHMPYGGVKHSGQGREGVKYAVEELVHLKLIVFKP
jgi:acyl-CoA reductase-like NAD-dependent aldehyde dehydrogenase